MSSVETIPTKEVVCEWKIDNFTNYPNQWGLLSPKFEMKLRGSLTNTIWYLRLFPIDETSGNIACYLMRGSDLGPEILELSYDILVIAIDGSSQRITFSPQPCSFTKDSTIDSVVNCGHGRDINGFLDNGILTLICRMWGSRITYPMHLLIRTQIQFQKRYFKWIIEGISSLRQKEEHKLQYSSYDVLPLQLLLSWSGEGPNKEIKIEINHIGEIRGQYVICQICVLDAEGKIAASKKDKYIFKNVSKGRHCWRFQPFIKKEWLLDNKDLYIPNDTLSLQFEIEALWNEGIFGRVKDIHFGGLSDFTSFPSSCSTSTIGRASPSVTKGTVKIDQFKVVSNFIPPVNSSGDSSHIPSLGSNSLMEGLLSLHLQSRFCDVTLKTNANSYPVHKAVLCAQSSVFTAMFEQDMKESLSGIVEILDLTDDTVQKMLLFMYTDTVQDLQWESAQNLYRVSDMYEIVRLKKLCKSFLKANIGVSNVIDVLVLADLHQDLDLKSASLDFVFEHDSELIDSDMWKSFMQEHLKLAAEFMHLLYKRKIKK